MKKVTMLATAIALAMTCSAQTEKGTFAIGLHNFSPIVPQAIGLLAPTSGLGVAFGTSVSEFNGNESKASYTTIGLSGSGHYFVVDNFSIGLNLHIISQSMKEKDGGDKYNFSILMAGPELRYYFPVTAKSKLWLSGSGAWGSSKTSSNGDSEEDPGKLSRYGGAVGLALFPFEHFSVDLGVGYGVFSVKDSYQNFSGDTIESKDTNSGIAVDVGFSVFF